MAKKTVIHCPNEKIHGPNKEPNKILCILSDSAIFVYCPSFQCIQDRKKTWTKIELSVAGQPVDFKDVAIKVMEMPKGYHIDTDKKAVTLDTYAP